VSDLAAVLHQQVTGRPRLRHVQSVLVARGGDVIVEHYFRSRRRDDRTNVHSVTKSVLSALVGIAISDGYLSLSSTVHEIVPDHAFDDGRKKELTVRHLLTMTSGLAADDEYDIDEIGDRGESWFAGPLAAPLVAEPGETFSYNNGAVHVLGILLARATGRTLSDYAAQNLFRPLGIDDFRWPTDGDGYELGYGHLELRPRDLLEFGRLYLDGGRRGRLQVVPGEWVRESTTAMTPGGSPEDERYGCLWWVTDVGGIDAFFAGGFGGQYVYVMPALDAVFVSTADVHAWIPSSGSPRRLVADYLIPALRV